MKKTKLRKKTSKGVYWYRIYFGACPVCCTETMKRERVYGKKPKRGIITVLSSTEAYDDCLEKDY
jgi:hypothetical protein